MIHRRLLRLASLAGLLGIAALVAFLAVNSSNAAPTVTTDKPDYHPNETVVITGGGFAPGTYYDIPVIRPDGSLVKGNGTMTLGWDSVVSNGSGGFTYNYKLDGIVGTYEIRVYHYGWNGNLSEAPLASVTFTDAPLITDFRQCANKDPSLGDCHWLSSILQTGNSVYRESMSVPQRLLFTNVTSTSGNVHTLEFSHQATKGGTHGYDWLTSWDQAVAGALAAGIPYTNLPGQGCAAVIGPPGSVGTTCSTLRSGPNSLVVSIPDDAYVDATDGSTLTKIAAFETTFGNRTIKIYGNAAISSASFTSITHTGPDTGDSDVNYVLTWASSSDELLIEMAGHLAVSGTSIPWAWGPAQGASQISGGPYHFKLDMLDGSSLGSQDNQIKGADIQIVKGKIVIQKVCNPVADPQLFTFTRSYGANMSLGCGGSDDSGFLDPSTYSVSEIVPAGWSLTSSTCSDGSSPASIVLGPGETVTCTFTNTKDSQIIIQKVCDPPADPQLFPFTRSYGANVNVGCAASNSSGTLAAGTYSVSEAVPAGWTLSSSTCSDGSSPASIGLSAGETVTCTFTNTKHGKIIIQKTCLPPGDPQLFTFSRSYGANVSIGCAGSNDSGFTLLPGTYTVTETVPAGWTLTGATCSDGSSPASIGLSAGETITCTFENTKGSQIIIEKVCNPAIDPQLFTFVRSYGANVSVGCGGSNSSGPLAPGTYSVSETVPAGWTLTGSTCDDLSSPGSIGLGAGEIVTCTFTNSKQGVTILKVCDPPADPQLFTFTRGYGANVNLACGGSNSTALAPGTYSVSEAVPAGWTLSSSTCSDGSSPASIGLSAGESVTCTFTNTKHGKIIIQKTCDPPADPQLFTFSRSYGANVNIGCGGSNDSGFTLLPGTYTVTETVPAAWTLASATCSDGSGPASIGLSAGETVTCTFANDAPGRIIIAKVCNPAADPQQFGFTRSYGANVNVGCGGSNISNNLATGTYSVSETVPAGWALFSSTCSDGSNPASISLGPGELVTCTFTNTKNGTIVVQKVCDPAADPQPFAFTGTAAGTIGCGGTITVPNLAPGAYTSTETVPNSSWMLTSIVCNDANSTGGLFTATFQLEAGEAVTCTFTNVKKGVIVIVKDAVPDDPVQDFAFNCSGPTAIAGFTLDDDLDGTFSNTATHTNLVPGSYNCSEAGPPGGWTLFSATCSDGSLVSAISLQPGETVTCTFENHKLGTILIDKITTPGGDPQTFSFTVSGPTACAPPAIADTSAPATCGNLVQGNYSVSETVPAGWALTSASCTDGTPASIPIDPGDVVTCTFNNAKNGQITIQKVCNPPADPQMFTFARSYGPNVSIGCGGTNGPVSLSPSTYTVAETVPAGWTLTSSSCSDGSLPSSISLGTGESVICTFTNAKAGTITINKVCNPPADPQTFTFTRSYGANVNIACGGSNGPVSVSPGTYSVSEIVPAGWVLTGSSCTAGSPGSIPVNAGDTVTCTFTNQRSTTIIIVKDTVPDAAQDFSIACGGLGVIVLDDDADGTLPNSHQFSDVAPGLYTCTETNVPGYQTTISCSDPDSGSTSSPPSASIDADAGETVTCTFVNTFHPGDNPVGGIAGLLDESDAPAQTDGGGTSVPWGPVAAGILLAAAAGAWLVARRRLA